jgi:hypothetical protein
VKITLETSVFFRLMTSSQKKVVNFAWLSLFPIVLVGSPERWKRKNTLETSVVLYLLHSKRV